MKNAIGLLETKGLIAAINGADAAVKAASVNVVKVEKIGSAYVTIVIRGDVAAVSAAIDAAADAASKYGQVISTSVIPRPHIDVETSFELFGEEECEK